MFHGFDYPDETGTNELYARFWRPVMENGIIRFKRPEECTLHKFIRELVPKTFHEGYDLQSVKAEALEIGG
jgi:CRISPR-associated protein Cas5d